MLTSHQAIAWTMVAALTGVAASLPTRAHAASSSPDPADVRAPTKPLVYQSPLAQWRPLSEAQVLAGRQAQIPAASPASDPHAGHPKK